MFSSKTRKYKDSPSSIIAYSKGSATKIIFPYNHYYRQCIFKASVSSLANTRLGMPVT